MCHNLHSQNVHRQSIQSLLQFKLIYSSPLSNFAQSCEVIMKKVVEHTCRSFHQTANRDLLQITKQHDKQKCSLLQKRGKEVTDWCSNFAVIKSNNLDSLACPLVALYSKIPSLVSFFECSAIANTPPSMCADMTDILAVESTFLHMQLHPQSGASLVRTMGAPRGSDTDLHYLIYPIWQQQVLFKDSRMPLLPF